MTDNMNYYEDILKDISELVQIPSVYDAATITEQMPYGKNVYRGYQWMKEKALKDGFEVTEYDGHVLAIRIKGNTSGERIDVVSHVDVVEPGDGWDEDPFSGRITDEYIYGRGTIDMKGTLMLTYHALKYIKENHIPCKNDLRVVVGCDEERTMGDIRYYITKAGEPDFAFTPDGKFPFSLGEKGATMWTLDGTMGSVIINLKGGVQCNVVSPIAEASVRDVENLPLYEKMLLQLGYVGKIVKSADKLSLTLYGRAAHASTPELGSNATVKLLELIHKVNHDPLAGLLFHCFADPYGEGAGIGYDIEPMGKLTLNLGVLYISDNHVDAQIECRYPLGVTSEVLTEKLNHALNPIKVSLKYDDKPTMADEASPYLNVLLDTYREVYDDDKAQPFISGGVTYSKAIKNCVAFGPNGKDDIELAHQANERIDLSMVKKLYELYKETMIRLANQ
ncbi:MAG TPA: Sapep family Mn(2+)-dependent dipeptidase [Mobilitalea sp.]|nr:Sapep family Mn(2+)-dependent dipeptidase [Mobilitalea sp.]